MFVLMFRLQRYELILIYANIFLEKKVTKSVYILCIYTEKVRKVQKTASIL